MICIFELVGYAVAGLFIGLVGGPLLLYALGMVVLKVRGHQQGKYVQMLRGQHNQRIKELRKEYERHRKRFTRTTVKLERIIGKAREEYQ